MKSSQNFTRKLFDLGSRLKTLQRLKNNYNLNAHISKCELFLRDLEEFAKENSIDLNQYYQIITDIESRIESLKLNTKGITNEIEPFLNEELDYLSSQSHSSEALKYYISSDKMKLYEIYVNRIMKHYDLRLSHFNTYFGFNSGLLIIIGFLIQPYSSSLLFGVPKNLFFALSLLTLLGVFFSLAWLMVSRNDRDVQLQLNEVIGEVEKLIFEEPKFAMYYQINNSYSPKKKWGLDILDINSYISILFFFLWIASTVFSIAMLFVR